jgi:hypothetical protein
LGITEKENETGKKEREEPIKKEVNNISNKVTDIFITISHAKYQDATVHLLPSPN